MRIGFIGAGAAAGALARALASAGVPVAALWARRVEQAEALAADLPGCTVVDSAQDVVDRVDLVVLAVPDGAIEPVCAALCWRPGVAVVHCSGALSVDVLASAARAGAQVGGCHPLQTLSGVPGDAELLAGSVFGIEAEEPLRTELVDLVRTIGGRPIVLSAADKALYHASAVLISNYTVTIARLAAELWEAFGAERGEALRALLPLLQGTVANLDTRGLPDALTGPIARGDAVTIERHLAALSRERPEVLLLYRELGRLTVPLARERGGASAADVEAVLAALGAPEQTDDEDS